MRDINGIQFEYSDSHSHITDQLVTEDSIEKFKKVWFKSLKFEEAKSNIWSLLPVPYGVPVVFVYENGGLVGIESPTLMLPWAEKLAPVKRPSLDYLPLGVIKSLVIQHINYQYVFGYLTLCKKDIKSEDTEEFVKKQVIKGSELVEFVTVRYFNVSKRPNGHVDVRAPNLKGQLAALLTHGFLTVNNLIQTDKIEKSDIQNLAIRPIIRDKVINLSLVEGIPYDKLTSELLKKATSLRKTLKKLYPWPIRYLGLVDNNSSVGRITRLPPTPSKSLF